jgi:hypothetical protein
MNSPKLFVYKVRYGIICLCLAVIAMMVFPPPANCITTSLTVSVTDLAATPATTDSVTYNNLLFASASRSYEPKPDPGQSGKTYSASSYGSFDTSLETVKFQGQASGYYADSSLYIYMGGKIFPQWVDPSAHSPDDYIIVRVTFDVIGTYNTVGSPFNANLYAWFGSAPDTTNLTGNWHNLSQTNLMDGRETAPQEWWFWPALNNYIYIAEQLGCWLSPGYRDVSASADFSHTGTIQVSILTPGATFTTKAGGFSLAPAPSP